MPRFRETLLTTQQQSEATEAGILYVVLLQSFSIVKVGSSSLEKENNLGGKKGYPPRGA